MIVPEHTNSTFGNDFMNAEMIFRYYNNFIWDGRYAECLSFEKTLELINFDFPWGKEHEDEQYYYNSDIEWCFVGSIEYKCWEEDIYLGKAMSN